ncbi:hypothetical protein IH824_19285 [candidate division KSB1 bacterium]|nr:hypothetical protein [candidate division KSB1 bacterium]
MNRKNLTGLIVCLLILPTLAFGQLKQDGKINMVQALTKPKTLVGLIGLDPNKFSMSHSYSLSFTSFGGQSYNQGLYLNTMMYQLSNPIKMYFQFGVQHQPFGQNEFQSQSQLFLELGLNISPRIISKYNLNSASSRTVFIRPIITEAGSINSACL